MGFQIGEYIAAWTDRDSTIILIGILCAMSCALLGNFLVLRKMSMMGDAISHAVLPGLTIGFLISHDMGGPVMMMGAVITGVMTAFFTQTVNRYGKVDESAAMGVVFTTLFAFGILLIVKFGDKAHIDVDCVLFGAIEAAKDNGELLFKRSFLNIPYLVNSLHLKFFILFIVNLLFTVIFYKELKISAFDPAMATSIGISSQFMHYLLMTLVAISTVLAFEAVGSILVIAMLIVPPATAYLLTDRLWLMIVLSLVVASLSAIFGHIGAITIPPFIGQFIVEGGENIYTGTRTSGMIAVAAGLMLVFALFLSPKYGIISRLLHSFKLSVKICCEDILGLLYRMEEMKAEDQLDVPSILKNRGNSFITRFTSRFLLNKRGDIIYIEGHLNLTESGREKASLLIRSHRLWESYLYKHLNKTMDHLHFPAEDLEHITDDKMRQTLAESLDHQEIDPQGRDIPPRPEK